MFQDFRRGFSWFGLVVFKPRFVVFKHRFVVFKPRFVLLSPANHKACAFQAQEGTRQAQEKLKKSTSNITRTAQGNRKHIYTRPVSDKMLKLR